MSNYAISLKRSGLLLAAMAFTAALTLVNISAFFSGKAGAVQLQSRSLTLSSSLEGDVGATEAANSELNGDSTTHSFQFDIPSTTSLQAIRFEYCTTAIGACTGPTGVDHLANDPTISVQELNNVAWPTNNWAEGTHTANRINLTNVGSAPGSADLTAEFSFTGIENPNVVGTFFVRITTYSDAFTTVVDDGTVASAITEGIAITSRVAETLGFSTTGAFAATAAGSGVDDPGANCAPLTGSGAITLGDPTEQTLSLTTAYDNYSAFRIYTNAGAGVVVNYEGETLTKPGGDNIDEINGGTGAAAASAPGDEQFGLAVDMVNGDNGTAASLVTVASRSAQIDLRYVNDTAALAANGPLSIVAAYNDGEGTIVSAGTASFAFNGGAPVSIASSTSFVECKTAAIRYIANIDPLTSAGTYTTKIVYSAVPTY